MHRIFMVIALLLNLLVFSMNNSFIAQASAGETVTVPFANGTTGVTTTQNYSGTVTVTVSGTGQASGTQLSDAFYLFTGLAGQPITPSHPTTQYNWMLWINGGPPDMLVNPIPVYRTDHTYTFTMQASGGQLAFAVGDTQTSDNTGSYSITVNSDTQPATTYSISGQVLDSSNAPIAGVIVSTDTGVSKTTSSDGSYSFTGLAAGDYIITPIKDGYVFLPPTRSLSLTGNVTSINFTANPVSPLTYAVSGQIVDDTGKGLAGVIVSDDKGHQTATIGKGIYKLNGLSVGSYTITPTKKGHYFKPSSRVIIVARDVTDVNFTTLRTYNISGKIVTTKNKPIADVTISYGAGLTTVSDKTGKYTINNIPAGNYTLTPSKEGFAFSPASQTIVVPTDGKVDFEASPTIDWPFSSKNKRWTIINAYRGAIDHALGGSANDYTHLAFDFAFCKPKLVNTDLGICDDPNVNVNWDSVEGEDIVSPVTGTVAYKDSKCLGIAIDIEGAPGYRVILTHVNGFNNFSIGKSVKQGITKLGTVSSSACVGVGNHIHMALYYCASCANNPGSSDPGSERKATAFSGQWAIGVKRCEYPDDGITTQEYLGQLVPCRNASKPGGS